jgi:hypothetical protein
MALRQQINVLRRTAPRRPRFGNIDRLVFVGLYRLFPSVRDALRIVQPETVIGWHRAGFRAYWRWKSRRRGGRPTMSGEIRRLIRAMSLANPLWGAPRIHGELLKLGIDIGQTSAAKYMARRRRPPSQGWRTFLRNHADGIAAIDLFVVPTISFRLLYGLLVLRHDRRRHPVDGCDSASDRRVDRPTGRRGLWVGAGTLIHPARSRPGLRQSIHPAYLRDGHPRSTDSSAIAMAKCLCGTADRIDSTGVH